jgi:Fe-S oxidoreductase
MVYSQKRYAIDQQPTRCVGVGACRRHDSSKGIMCPNYMATREERYSTRGRARLLFEMLHGDPIGNLWRSEAVEEALDLCLACKGCKSDCPVHVDMATNGFSCREQIEQLTGRGTTHIAELLASADAR